MANPKIANLDPAVRNRLRQSNIAFLVLWCLGIFLILSNAPFWSIILNGILGSYFALRDWRIILPLAKDHVNPPHPDPDIQELIDKKINITEYRLRKESLAAKEINT